MPPGTASICYMTGTQVGCEQAGGGVVWVGIQTPWCHIVNLISFITIVV